MRKYKIGTYIEGHESCGPVVYRVTDYLKESGEYLGQTLALTSNTYFDAAGTPALPKCWQVHEDDIEGTHFEYRFEKEETEGDDGGSKLKKK